MRLRRVPEQRSPPKAGFCASIEYTEIACGNTLNAKCVRQMKLVWWIEDLPPLVMIAIISINHAGWLRYEGKLDGSSLLLPISTN